LSVFAHSFTPLPFSNSVLAISLQSIHLPVCVLRCHAVLLQVLKY